MVRPQHTLAEALALRATPAAEGEHFYQTPDFRALNAITGRIASRFRNEASFRALSHSEQLVYTIGFMFDAEMLNGGLYQYLANSAGNTAEECRSYLRELGSHDVLEALKAVEHLFPNGVFPTDRDLRNVMLDAAEEASGAEMWALFDKATDAYYAVCPALYSRLMDYVQAHVADFARPTDDEVREALAR